MEAGGVPSVSGEWAWVLPGPGLMGGRTADCSDPPPPLMPWMFSTPMLTYHLPVDRIACPVVPKHSCVFDEPQVW